MERLTTNKNECNREMICRFEDCDICEEYCPHMNEDNCSCLQAVLEKLGEYEDAEEQGLLLRLPCKVGDTVYRLIPKTYRHIEPLKVRKFVICENGLCFVTEKTSFHYSCDEFEEFIFLTQEEAEQALKQMGE